MSILNIKIFITAMVVFSIIVGLLPLRRGYRLLTVLSRPV